MLLLYSIFTHDLPAVIEGQGGVKTLLYADDLAICARDLISMQEAMNRLHAFCRFSRRALSHGHCTSGIRVIAPPMDGPSPIPQHPAT